MDAFREVQSQGPVNMAPTGPVASLVGNHCLDAERATHRDKFTGLGCLCWRGWMWFANMR